MHVLVTGCLSGKILFWDIIKRDVICSFTIKGKITTGEIQNNDQTLVIGTELGVIRFFNIANIRKPVLTKVIKIYNKKPITCLTYNPDNSIIAVSSVDSPKIYFLNAA